MNRLINASWWTAYRYCFMFNEPMEGKVGATTRRRHLPIIYDKEWDGDSCRNAIGHRWVEKSVQLAALWLQVAPPVIGHR